MSQGSRKFKVRLSGSSLFVGLPVEYASKNDIKRGRIMELTWDGPVLTLKPSELSEEPKKENKPST